MQNHALLTEAIKAAILRLFFIIGSWILFFMVYAVGNQGEPSFKPIVMGVLGIYALLELVGIVEAFWREKQNSKEN
jgi:hypothetical protein